MALYYSSMNNGFYDGDMQDAYMNAETWPEDAVEVSAAVYQEMMDGQASGAHITSDENGYPKLEDYIIDWEEKANARRDELIVDASRYIADWRMNLELGVISPNEKEQLILWALYLRSLKEMDFSGVHDESGYNSIIWEATPEKAEANDATTSIE